MKAIVPLLLVAALLPAAPTTADVLLLDAIKDAPPNSPSGLYRPARGMSQEQVKQQFGAPVKELPWVGDPPITRWVYNGFTVYFEYQYVIETVVHR